MNENEILKKLLKIASNQQKILEKLAQITDNEEVVAQSQKFLGGQIVNWMMKNEINARESHHFETSNDPGFDFVLDVVFSSPQTGVPVSSPFPNVAEKFKADFAQVLATSPFFKDKSVKINVSTQ